jgi:hypothetical protein
MSSTYYSFDLEVASSGGQSTSNVILYDPSATSYVSLPSGRTSITGLAPNYFTRNSRAFVGAGDDTVNDAVVSNYNASTYANRYLGVVSNGTGGRGYCNWFMNSYLRTADGGALTATLRNDAGALRLQAGGLEAGITVKSDGNVALNGSMDAGGTVSCVGTLALYNAVTPTDGFLRFTTAGSANYIQSGLTATSNSKADLIFTSIYGATEWMRIKASNGYLGIGINAPTAPLDVQGIINMGAWNGLYDSIVFNRGPTANTYPNITCQDNTIFMYASGAGGWLTDTAVGDMGIRVNSGRSIRFGANGGSGSGMVINSTGVGVNVGLYLGSVPQNNTYYGTRALCLNLSNQVCFGSSVGRSTLSSRSSNWAGGVNLTNAFYRHNSSVSVVISGLFSCYTGSSGTIYPYIRIYSQSSGYYYYFNQQNYQNITYAHTSYPFSVLLNADNAGDVGWYDIYIYSAGNIITDTNDVLVVTIQTFNGNNF